MNDNFGLSGKTALVTGSGRNIGRAIALELVARGANVIVNAHRNEAEASAVAQEAARRSPPRPVPARPAAACADEPTAPGLARPGIRRRA